MAEHGIEWMLFYFTVFILSFFCWNICGFNGAVVVDTDRYTNSHSVWTPAGLSFSFLSCYQDWLYHSEQAKRLCRYVMWRLLCGWNWRGRSHMYAWISIHLHLTITPGKCVPGDWASRLSRFSGATYAHVDIRQLQINAEPLVSSKLSSHPFLKIAI